MNRLASAQAATPDSLLIVTVFHPDRRAALKGTFKWHDEIRAARRFSSYSVKHPSAPRR
jgi:hypothetical protein